MNETQKHIAMSRAEREALEAKQNALLADIENQKNMSVKLLTQEQALRGEFVRMLIERDGADVTEPKKYIAHVYEVATNLAVEDTRLRLTELVDHLRQLGEEPQASLFHTAKRLGIDIGEPKPKPKLVTE